MQGLIEKIFPHLPEKLPEFYKAIKDTMIMTGWSGILIFIFGLFLGIVVIVTKKGGILENKIIFQISDKLINFFRSIPFIILLAALIPFTRIIMGTAIGIAGAIVPLVVGTVPFFARQIESALSEIDDGIIEAAQSMGTSSFGIIFRIYLKEGFAAIVRGTTITIISLIGLTAMAGAVGAGGLGDFAIHAGRDRNRIDIIYASVIVLVFIVTLIQLIGDFIAKKSTH
ncbi:ABC transporter permease [Lachnospiraceae bacterium ZAX-1]